MRRCLWQKLIRCVVLAATTLLPPMRSGEAAPPTDVPPAPNGNPPRADPVAELKRKELAERRGRAMAESYRLYDAGDLAGATRAGEEALDLDRQLLGNRYDETMADLVRYLAGLHLLREDFVTSRKAWELAIHIETGLRGADSRDVLDAKRSLEEVEQIALATAADRRDLLAVWRIEPMIDPFQQQKKLEDALQLSEQAVAVRSRCLGPDSLALARSLQKNGLLHAKVREFDVAERQFRAAATMRRKLLGLGDPLVIESISSLANVLESKADASVDLTDYDVALQLQQEALEIRKTIPGTPPWQLRDAQANLAELEREKAMTPMTHGRLRLASDMLDRAGQLASQNRPREAAAAAAQGRSIYRQNIPAEDSRQWRSARTEARYRQRFDAPAAEKLFEEALRIQMAAEGADHPDYKIALADDLERRAALAREEGRYGDAVQCFTAALSLRESVDGIRDGDSVMTTEIAYCLRASHLPPDLQTLLREADHRAAGAATYERERLLDKARVEVRKELSLRQQVLREGQSSTATAEEQNADRSSDEIQIAWTRERLASLLLNGVDRDADQAVALCRQSLAARQRLQGPRHPEARHSRQLLADALVARANDRDNRGDYTGGQQDAREALEIRRGEFPRGDSKITSLQKAVAYTNGLYALPAALQAKVRESETAADRAQDLRDQGRYAEERAAWLEALRLHREAMGENDYRYAQLLVESAYERFSGLSESNAAALRQASDFYRSAYGPQSPEYLDTAQNEHQLLIELYPAAQKAADPAPAVRIGERLLILATDLYGAEAARTKDIRLALKQSRTRASFGDAERAQLAEANRLAREARRVTADGSPPPGAVQMMDRVLEVERALFGEDLTYADLLEDRADLHREAHDLANADRDEAAALQLRLALIGPRHPVVVASRLHRLYRERGEARQREDPVAERRALHELLSIRRQSVGRSDWRFIADRYAMEYLDVVASLDKTARDALAEADRNLDQALKPSMAQRPAEAIRAAEKAVAIRAKYLGLDSVPYADALLALAQVHFNAGDLGPAEPALQDAARLYERWFGENTPMYARVSQRMGLLYAALADLPRASAALKDSVTTQARFLAAQVPGDPEIDAILEDAAQGLTYLVNVEVARLMQEKGPDVPSQAASVLTTVQDWAEQLKGSSRYREMLAMRGKLEALAGNLERAEQTFKEVRNVALTASPGPQRQAAESDALADLGWLYQLKHDPAAARASFQAALDLTRARLGGESFETVGLLQELARVARSEGKLDEAIALMQRSMELGQERLDRFLATAAESKMSRHLSSFMTSVQELVELVALRKQSTGPEVEAAMTWILKRKTAALAAVARRREALSLELQDARIAEKSQRLRALRERIKGLTTAPPRGASAVDLYAIASELRDEADAIESELGALASAHQGAARADVTVGQARMHLGTGGALIEFFRGGMVEPANGAPGHPPHYYAFILHKDAKRAVRMVDLGEADVIDEAVERARTAIKTFRPGTDDEAAKEVEFKKIAAELYALIFRPELVEALGGAKDLYIAPDGKLNQIPFEAFVAGPKATTYLVEDGYRFAYLTSGQELLRAKGEPGTGTVVFAGPDFGESAAERVAVASTLRGAKPLEGQMRGVHPTRGGRRFEPLGGANREADEVLAAMATGPFSPVKRLYRGKEALRQAFLSLHGPRLLHVATHGFFDPDPGMSGGAADKTAGVLALNPLLRSGLAFAGANTSAVNSEDGDDGLVTAEEICLMDLRGTELVVLSACDTGLGDLQAGQGVYGLRWAFLTAGARSLVTSLFHVPDAETQQLMATFYASLKVGNNKVVALHDAELAAIQSRRKTSGAAHPFYWSSFVLVGAME